MIAPPALDLKCGEGLLGAVIEATTDVVFVRDLEGRYLLLNSAAAKAGGATVEALLGKDDSLFFPPDVVRELREDDRRVIADDQTRSFERKLSLAGEERIFHVTKGPCRDQDGRVVGVFVISRDVTEQKRADEARAALLERELATRRQAEWGRSVAEAATRTLRSLENITEAALVSLDTDEVLDELMAAIRDAFHVDVVAATLLDEKKGELELRASIGFVDAVAVGVRFPAEGSLCARILAERRPMSIDDLKATEFNCQFLADRGVRSMLGVPLRTSDGAIGAVEVGTFSPRHFDAAEASLLQLAADRVAIAFEHAQLYESARRATRTRDEVLAIVAHDLRSPLSGIMLSASAMRRASRGTAVVPGEEQPVDLILASAKRMNRLIEDLLDVTRIESGQLTLRRESVSVDTLIGEAVDLAKPMTTAKSIRIEARTAPDLPAIDGDRHRLLQVLANILGNAIKFSPEAGTIVVAADLADDAVRISVADEGPGIPEQDLLHVFDRFWRGREAKDRGGAGLGLSIARGIVERHGGRIDVASTFGRGTTFRFTLPTLASDS